MLKESRHLLLKSRTREQMISNPLSSLTFERDPDNGDFTFDMDTVLPPRKLSHSDTEYCISTAPSSRAQDDTFNGAPDVWNLSEADISFQSFIYCDRTSYSLSASNRMLPLHQPAQTTVTTLYTASFLPLRLQTGENSRTLHCTSDALTQPASKLLFKKLTGMDKSHRSLSAQC